MTIDIDKCKCAAPRAEIALLLQRQVVPELERQETAMRAPNEVEQFFETLTHPMKAEMKKVREIIMAASPLITETVKWGGPSFEYCETLVTFSPRVKDCAALVFHDGAPFLERFPFLEAGPKGKAYAKFRSMEEVDRHGPELTALVAMFVACKGGV